MAHGFLCTCKKCNPSVLDALFRTTPKKSNFSKKLPNGTTIYGPGDRPGNKHGHTGKDFHRTPHSTIGSAAIGKPHTEKKHRTDRW